MNPEETNKSLLAAIGKTLDDLFDFSISSQGKISKQLESGMSKLETDNRGFIKTTSKNITTALRITLQAANKVPAKSAQKAAEEFANGYSVISEINNKFFAEEFENFNPAKVFETTLDIAIENTLAATTNQAWKTGILNPMRTMLNQAIKENLLFSQAVRNLTNLIEGTRSKDTLVRGIVEKHWVANRITRDALFQFNSDYHNLQGQLTNGVWYQYVGGLVKDSRNECRRRVKVKYFHQLEIKDNYGLGKQITKSDWPEKIPGVSNFTQRGGYNCLHNLLLIAARRVPQKRKDEVAQKYNI